MKERPILFSAPMVLALLAGTKTQTRRVAKEFAGRDDLEKILRRFPNQNGCPYGQPGDRLWVRESWFPDPPADGTWAYAEWAGCREGQIAGVPDRFRHPAFCCYAADWLHGEVRWTPSIHMPRWASRITLEITSVRIERLQDISEQDAAAEGVATWAPGALSPESLNADPSDQFRWLWCSINGPDSWGANPWVWVVEFKRVQQASSGRSSQLEDAPCNE